MFYAQSTSAVISGRFSSGLWFYFACVREVVCHCFRACVCSGHIPHHKCCSVYVISRVQIVFYTTPHHIKRFHTTRHSIKSHQKILHHTTFHVAPFHITPPLHVSHSVLHTTCSTPHLADIECRNTWRLGLPHSTSDITLHRYFTPPHLKATVHISHHSTSRSILHHTHVTFNISTFHTITLRHHIWHCNTLLFFFLSPRLTYRNNRTTHCMCHILHRHNSTLPDFTYRNFPRLAFCNIPHTRTPGHSTSHFAFQSHSPMSKMTTFHIDHISHRTISHIKSRSTKYLHTIPHHAHIPPHTTPCSSHSNINYTPHYPTAHNPHCISNIPHHTTMSNVSSHSTPLGILQTYSHLSSQHTIIFHIYHNTIPHRIITLHIWHCTSHCHTISHISCTVAPYSTSQPH